MFIACYGFNIVNYTPYHDGLQIVYDAAARGSEISVGRFFAWYYIPLRGPINSPWFIALLVYCFTAFSIFLTMSVLEIPFDTWRIAVVSSLFFFNITFMQHSMKFIYFWDMACFALLLSVSAVYILSGMKKKLPAYFISIVLLAVSMGIYQCYLAFAIGLFLILLCKQIYDNDKTSQILKNAGLYIADILGAGIIYFILIKLFQKINHIEPASGLFESTDQILELSFGQIIRNIVLAFNQVLNHLLISKVYNSEVFLICNYVVFLTGIAVWIWFIVKECKVKWNILLLALIALAFPIGVNCVSILTNGHVTRVAKLPYQLSYIILLFPVLYKKTVFRIKNKSISVVLPVLAVTAIMSLCVIKEANSIFYYQKLLGEGINAKMTNILYDIERDPDYIDGETPLIIVGNVESSIKGDYKDIYNNSLRGARPNTTLTHYYCFNWYMRYIFGQDFVFEDDDEVIDALTDSESVKNMPAYPSSGYCDVIDGHMIIKLQ